MNPWSLTDALDEAMCDPWICDESPVWVLVDNALFEVVACERTPRKDGKGPVVLIARPLPPATAKAFVAGATLENYTD